MIGFLKGTVHTKYADSILLLTGGVGYQVFLGPAALTGLNVSSSLELYIYSHIREDVFDLYGFKTSEELQTFKLLTSVSGIGSKTALLVIDQGAPRIQKAILNADVDFFTSIPRLGRKNAQKIIIELKTKVGSLTDLDLSSIESASSELSEALLSMGYTKQELAKTLSKIPTEAVTLEQKVRAALRLLAN